MERPYASLEGLEARRHSLWYIGYPFSLTQHLLCILDSSLNVALSKEILNVDEQRTLW